MKKPLFYLAGLLLITVSAHAQLSFTNSSNLLNQTFNSGGVVGVSDMNGDGLDDIVHMNNSRRVMIEYQNPDGSYTLYDYGNVSGSNQWGMCIGDVDANGHNDVFSGGSFDGVHLLMIDSPGDAELLAVPNGDMFMQGCNMADINNDGHLDAFGCHDVGTSRIWGNNGFGELVFQNWIALETVPVSDNSGNYGSVWSDVNNDGHLDLYIAKCRQGVSNPLDPRRINTLYLNDGNGNYTEVAEERGLVIYSQSWTADFADIDNDGDMDCLITNHDNTMTLLENDGNGYFTDITDGSGLEISGFFLQAIMKDFDNDGFVDVLYAGGLHGYLKGNGDGTFSPQPGMFPNSDTMHSFAIGDLNNDGFLDVYSSYGNGYVNADNNNPDILWLNNANNNNYIAFNLEGTLSHVNAIGSRVEIYGDWGVQIREVRSGESYGINNSFQIHFGLGQATEVDSVVIKWPSGGIETFNDLVANQVIDFVEGSCVAEPVAIVADGPTILCEGDEITLTVSEGESYLWTNGETTQSIVVNEPGNFGVTVFDAEGCFANAPIVQIDFEPDQTPEILTQGELEFCGGQSVTLTATESDSYLWSSGEETQSIDVFESGEYFVTVQGVCSDFVSESIEVVVFDTPDAPFAEGDVIPAPGTANLMAMGDNISWFDVPEGGEVLGTGNNFETPFIEETTSFYAEDALIIGGETFFGGKENNAGNGGIQTNSTYFLIFNANEDMIIRSVYVYAEGSGERTILVTAPGGGEVIAQGDIFIPDGDSRIDLNFEIPAGTGYEIKTTGNPELFRNSNGSNLQYPYALGDLGAITGTNITGSNEFEYYYFFYDWEVERPQTLCVSDRTEVLAVVDTATSVDDMQSNFGFDLFPVPARESLNVQFGFQGEYFLELFDISGKAVLSQGGQSSVGHVEALAVDHLSTGLYLVRVVADGHTTTKRVVLQ